MSSWEETKKAMKINHIKGDATHMLGAGTKVLAHVVNSRGGWGKGFVLAISKRWKEPEQAYREWAKEDTFKLGNVQMVQVDKYTLVANMLCQYGFRGGSNKVPLQYDALRKCLQQVAGEAKRLKASVHMPKGMGSGLAGGKYIKIAQIVEEELCEKGIAVTMYDYE
jgi:O-acetyl-ADP-ribose deacetylase (regulator of RNase III)